MDKLSVGLALGVLATVTSVSLFHLTKPEPYALSTGYLNGPGSGPISVSLKLDKRTGKTFMLAVVNGAARWAPLDAPDTQP